MRLDFEGVSIDIDSARIVSDVSLSIAPGEMVGLVGPNGSGKSTLLRSAYRVLRPTGGAVLIGGDNVWSMSAREAACRRAIVTQHTVLGAEFSVEEIVAMGRTPRKGMLDRDTDQDRRTVEQALDDVHMRWAAQRSFATLSGGEQQRVLLARALAQEAGLLILDEPTNHLDVRAQFEVLDLLRHLGMTTLTALHDLDHAVSYCDRVAVMAEGRLVAVGEPTEVLTPELVHDVFGVRAVLDTHPITGRPRITVASAGHRPTTTTGDDERAPAS
ncbi:ABC transporter ATP-binding protein [Streptomyces sp. ME02-8801-2C]|uniref:ABC transporter ATP-binding protein n=1 Tax=Streptomyces sp. ME02-8801-2C TaxID=3028680 RepID=UPI0029B19183|nr:ABC transporter ATP-binding protein [Streptomyces sp. ME02-8801-2C]MDX3452991.1 ABC transporter ATP-binding protein [Streptomyces sp. ME02-8801-2C]